MIIHTNHKNFVYKSLTSDRVLRWRLYIEEYSPEIKYIKGEKNVVTDALSRLSKTEEPINDNFENFYRDVWRMRAHILAPLSKLTSSKVKWHWTEEHQNAFEEMKRVIAKETMLNYPNFSKPFHIHTDASDVQLGACISQDGKSIAFYSRTLNSA